MSIIKYIERLKYMDHLIKLKCTGNALGFSKKLGISVSHLKEQIREMRELGANITFDRRANSYVYNDDRKLILKIYDTPESSRVIGR